MLQAFPSITTIEFSQASQALEARCHDRLDGTDWVRAEWKGDGFHIRKAIARTDKSEIEERGESGNGLEKWELENECDEDHRQSIVRRVSGIENEDILIDFSVLLSPTYQVPVLWFRIDHLPPGEAQSLEMVYKYIVPQSSLAMLQQVGVLGGISIGHHPKSDQPAFFLHPCNTPDALRSLNTGDRLTPEQYLCLWVGLIGPSVGLHIPSKLLSE